jgi:hypothetical protein
LQFRAALCGESVCEERKESAIVDPHVEHNLSRYRGAEIGELAGFEEFEICVLSRDEDSRVAPSPTVSLDRALLEGAKLIAQKCGVRFWRKKDGYVIEVDRWQGCASRVPAIATTPRPRTSTSGLRIGIRFSDPVAETANCKRSEDCPRKTALAATFNVSVEGKVLATSSPRICMHCGSTSTCDQYTEDGLQVNSR